MSDGYNEAFTPKIDDMGPFYRHIDDTHLNPHPQYATDVDLTAHVAASDPHPGYRLESVTIGTTDLANDAVTAAKIATAVAGNGLTGGGGTALAVGAGTGITVAADDVALSIAQRENLKMDRRAPSTTRSTTSTSAVNWPVTDTLSVAFTKVGGSGVTNIYVQVFGSCYHDTAGGLILFGVSCNGTDYINSVNYFQSASTHVQMMGHELITVTAAGSYTIMCRAYTAAGTLSIDNNDRWQIVAREVPA